MELKTKNKLLIAAIVVLLVLCAVEGFVLYRHSNRSFSSAVPHDIDSFSSTLRNNMQNNRKDTWELFDRFFNDDFFSNKQDPFREMERFQNRMHEMMEKEMPGAFDHSWDAWFGDRFLGGGGDLDMVTTEKENDYIITLRIPNLKDNHLNIQIDKSGISVDGEYTQAAEKKDAQGHVVSKEEIHRTLSRNFPLPPDADYLHAAVDNRGDEIVITLPKLMHG